MSRPAGAQTIVTGGAPADRRRRRRPATAPVGHREELVQRQLMFGCTASSGHHLPPAVVRGVARGSACRGTPREAQPPAHRPWGGSGRHGDQAIVLIPAGR